MWGLIVQVLSRGASSGVGHVGRPGIISSRGWIISSLQKLWDWIHFLRFGNSAFLLSSSAVGEGRAIDDAEKHDASRGGDEDKSDKPGNDKLG